MRNHSLSEERQGERESGNQPPRLVQTNFCLTKFQCHLLGFALDTANKLLSNQNSMSTLTLPRPWKPKTIVTWYFFMTICWLNKFISPYPREGSKPSTGSVTFDLCWLWTGNCHLVPWCHHFDHCDAKTYNRSICFVAPQDLFASLPFCPGEAPQSMALYLSRPNLFVAGSAVATQFIYWYNVLEDALMS